MFAFKRFLFFITRSRPIEMACSKGILYNRVNVKIYRQNLRLITLWPEQFNNHELSGPDSAVTIYVNSTTE